MKERDVLMTNNLIMAKVKNGILCSIICLISILSTSNVSALGVGVYGGYNHANLSFKEAPDLTSSFVPNYIAGAYGYIGLIPNFGIPFVPTLDFQVEVAYTSKGGKLESKKSSSLSSFNLNTDLDLSYLEIPLLLKPRLSIYFIDVYALGGVSLSFLQLAKQSVSNKKSKISTDVKELVNNINVNYFVGGGLAYEFLTLFEVFIEARYSASLLETVKGKVNSTKPSGSSASLSNFQHSDIYIIAGIGLKI